MTANANSNDLEDYYNATYDWWDIYDIICETCHTIL